MAIYEADDIVTFYFVVKEINGQKAIQGYTTDEALAKFYIDFHQSRYFKFKSMTASMASITKILNENPHDEIKIYHIQTRNRNKKKKSDSDTEMIAIPATESEIFHIKGIVDSYLGEMINYSKINEMFPYLKPKYQEALKMIKLYDLIMAAIYNKRNKFSQSIEFDRLMLLLYQYPENFES